jgi:NADH:ubiquinone oxidoreductase subunit F (NADH-binding)
MTTTPEVARTTEWPRRLLAGVEDGVALDLEAHHRVWGAMPQVESAQAVRFIGLVEASGLLGRGGAGFPAGRKLRSVAAGGRPAVVVANGCDGEPASSKDTVLLRNAPHLVLDGIQLAAAAVGADTAYLVVHQGSGLADQLGAALGARRPIDRLRVRVREIPARYVSSEETALVSFLDGGDARPAFTPPRPFERGVDRRPTLVNNVETLAHLATIARRGDEWFRGTGDPAEPGTLLVTLTAPGCDRQVAEVPTGTTIGDIAARAGVSTDDDAAGVLVGGYFGSWLPMAQARGMPLSHHALRDAGAAFGAGVVAVLPSDRCGIAETARLATFLAQSGAGQCGPCLNGLPAIAAALRSLATGPWDERSWEGLRRWMAVVPGRGACRHPDGAVRMVASALTTFAADAQRHRHGVVCSSVHAPGLLPVPAVPSDRAGWR